VNMRSRVRNMTVYHLLRPESMAQSPAAGLAEPVAEAGVYVVRLVRRERNRFERSNHITACRTRHSKPQQTTAHRCSPTQHAQVQAPEPTRTTSPPFPARRFVDEAAQQLQDELRGSIKRAFSTGRPVLTRLNVDTAWLLQRPLLRPDGSLVKIRCCRLVQHAVPRYSFFRTDDPRT
jgi:hypothetical protein